MPPDDTPRKPWERQRGESGVAFQAFVVYRDLGLARSLAAVASELAKDKSLVERWSRRWGWVARCEAYDVERDRLDRMAQQRHREEALARHAALGASMTAVALKRLAGVDKDGEKVEKLDPNSLTPSDIATLAREGIRAERMAYGEPTDLVRGAFMVGSFEVTKLVGQMVEIALRYIPEDAEDAYLRDVRALQAG